MKRTNADLKRQLDKWQKLENKGDAEVEEMRKRRMELEVEAKQLENRVAELEEELESAREGDNKALEKERKKVEKLKVENDRMAVCIHAGNRIIVLIVNLSRWLLKRHKPLRKRPKMTITNLKSSLKKPKH